MVNPTHELLTPMIHVSNVCRVEMTPELLALATRPGTILVPEEVLEPRQIRLFPPDHDNPLLLDHIAVMRWHRDTYVPTITRLYARSIEKHGLGIYVQQALLVYQIDAYLQDSDVQADEQELAKATKAKNDGADLVVVAVVGESRSPLSVCRNVASGCQRMEDLSSDAAAAMGQSNVFLIED